MAKKRLTKEQKEIIEKEKLRRRIADIATGAAGYEFDTTDDFATADFLSRFIPALRVLFYKETKEENHTFNNEHLFYIGNINNFDNIDTTTDFFFEHGVRATE